MSCLRPRRSFNLGRVDRLLYAQFWQRLLGAGVRTANGEVGRRGLGVEEGVGGWNGEGGMHALVQGAQAPASRR